MNKAVGLIGAAGIGAGMMYLCDPDRGKGRRAEIRNKAKHFNRIATETCEKTGRDMRNRMLGVCAEMRSLVRCDEVSDDVLQARIRSKLGRIVTHPHAVEVKVVDGVAILSGPILAAEVHPLLNGIECMAGVKNIDNLLEIHETADIPPLQGGRRHTTEGLGLFRTTCSPTTRVMAGVAGGALTFYGGKRRGLAGTIFSTVGLGMLASAFTNLNVKRSPANGIDAEGNEAEPITTDVLIDAAAKAETMEHSRVV